MTNNARRLDAVEGWIELGLLSEAAEELHNLPPGVKSTVEVLKLWVRIYAAQKAWSNVELVCETLAAHLPRDTFTIVNRAEASHQQGDSGKALVSLKLGEESFYGKAKAEYFYAVARYACAIGSVTLACSVLGMAFDLDPGLRLTALGDHDLEKAWIDLQEG